MGIPVNEIVAGFKEKNCILLLGPGLSIDKNGGSLQPGLLNYFKEKQLEIEEEMDSLYRCKKQTKTRAYGYLREYYRGNSEPSQLHKDLARIPCHLYVSINPDLLLRRALEDFGVEHEFKYYVKGMPSEEVASPTAERPLLYNLFGSIDNQQSLIFTHDDLINYLFSIIREFKLPQNLRSMIENNLYFIFLGFDFEKWYLRLLLKLFLDENKLSIASEAGTGTQDKLRTFYAGNYGLEFVEDEIHEYIKRLYDECGRQNLLRPINKKSEVSIQDEIRELIRKDKVSQALRRLYEFLDGTDDQVFKAKAEDKKDLLIEIDVHSAQLSRVERDLRMQLTTGEQAAVEKNRIVAALQYIAGIFD